MMWKSFFLLSVLAIFSILLINAQSTGETISGNVVTGKNTQNFNLQITVGDPLPLITIISPENISYLNGVNLLVNYTTINADYVWYNLDGGLNFSLSGPIYISPNLGSHKLQIFVNNSYGINNSANVTFAIVSQTTIPPPGGCDPKEDCGAWSACINGNRTRTCVDLNKCFADKIEKISCIDQLTSNCSLSFNTGWNFISLCEQLNNYSVKEVLKPIDGHYEYILEWDDQKQEFRVWTKKGQKDFNKFNYLKSYFVFYQGSQKNVNLTGERFNSLDIPLVRGWESPLYPYDFESKIIGNKFYSAEFNYMLDWDRESQEFRVYAPLLEVPQFNKILPGKGYFINTNASIIRYKK